MPQVTRHSLAICGAGPIGLETAALALEAGLDVHVFERGEIGAHVLAWGHVRMFTPWSDLVGPASARLLARHGHAVPTGGECPTGLELVERVLQPLAATPELRGRVHTYRQVVAIARHGLRKGDALGSPERATHPFRVLVRDAGGQESHLHAYGVVDATGTYGTPNWAGTGGIPARGEAHLATQMSHHADDVLGVRRARHAGRTTLVIGGGATAVTTVTALARLAEEAPGTQVEWVTRRAEGRFTGEVEHDTLPARAELFAEGHRLQRGESSSVRWTGGAEVEGFEYNSATHRYRTQVVTASGPKVIESDQVIVNCGAGPDGSLYRELQVQECHASLAPMKLASALLGAGTSDCTAVPALGADTLTNPEPCFFILGAKSYGRNQGAFLMRTGYAQAAEAVAMLATALGAPQGA
jgi:thioredoxin reductase